MVIGQNCDANGQPVFPPVGLADIKLDKIQQELLAHCQLIQPQYFPVLSIEEVEGRKLIVLWAPGGQNRPYKAPESVTANKKTWRHYIRRYSSTVEAKGEAERDLLSLAAKVPFDDRYNQSARIDDLSKPLMQAFLQEVGGTLAEDASGLSVEALARQMNVAGGPTESPWPKNVGLLFFNETPERFFPALQIDVVWFPEGAGGDRFEEKIETGDIARMTREALAASSATSCARRSSSIPTAPRPHGFGTSLTPPSRRPWSTRSITGPTRSASPSRCASVTKNWSS